MTMPKDHPIELFMPPNMLKAKVGGGNFSGLDMAAINRGEAAMDGIKSEFSAWAASQGREKRWSKNGNE